MEVDRLSLVGMPIENVSKLFKRIKPGKVPLTVIRPANPIAVINELDKLSNDNEAPNDNTQVKIPVNYVYVILEMIILV